MAASVILVKKFTYRDQREEWSNRYHLDTGFADEDDFNNVANFLADHEKTVYPPNHSIIRSYGYANDEDNALYVHDYEAANNALVGTYDLGGGGRRIAPGDAAMTVRWYTGRVNSRGKKIYLRKYFHGAVILSEAEPDKLEANQHNILQAFGEFLLESDLGDTQFFAGSDGVRPTGTLASPFITTRTLKRRGRRPPT